MPTFNSRFALASIAIVLVLGYGLYAVTRLIKPKPTVFLTTKVIRSTIEISVTATGILQAFKQVDVGAQVSGQLKDLKVQLGEHVAKGQWLAEIDPVLSENSLRSVQATYDSLQAQKQAAEANLWQSEIALKRQKEMIAAEATSRQELDAAKALVLVNKANMASFEAQMRQAKTQVDSAKASLAYTRILAPIEGEVAAILTQEGQTIVAAQQAPVILKIANLDQMTVHAQISEADVTKIHIGDEATFTILGNPQDNYSGKLRAIEPAPQAFLNDVPKVPGPVFYNALFDVPNSARKLRIGMTAKVLIVLKRVANALLVPISAMGPREASGKYAVRILRANESPRTVLVPVGISNNISTEILEGLKEGDEVVIGESVEPH
jgi:macrolide-specific efflux system membrane fusion protein